MRGTSPLWALVSTLAAYRLTRLWIKDTVPPLPAVRALMARKLIAYEEAHEGKPHPLEPLTHCWWCAGFWVSLAAAVLESVPATRRWWRPLALALASSAVVAVAAERLETDD